MHARIMDHPEDCELLFDETEEEELDDDYDETDEYPLTEEELLHMIERQNFYGRNDYDGTLFTDG